MESDRYDSRLGDRPTLTVVSAVFPFPRLSGQQQRVYYKLVAFAERFRVTFLGLDESKEPAHVEELQRLCHRVILLPRRYTKTPLHKLAHRILGTVYTASTGLKLSNYAIDRVELPPERVAASLPEAPSDLALFEYWHAARSTAVFSRRGTRTVLDMHDILWRSLGRQLSRPLIPSTYRDRRVGSYRRREEAAWRRFDALIAINSEERAEAKRVLGGDRPVYLAPMGTDLVQWPYSWDPAVPPRVVYYGGLGNPQRQADAMICYREIMPLVWKRVPAAELWLIGSDPSSDLVSLAAADPRLHVTGTLPRVQETLATATLLLCPWRGTYGFRSRLIEAMAIGVPVVTSPDAVWGMDLEPGRGLFLESSSEAMATTTVRLLESPRLAAEQSLRARREVEANFSFEATYGALARDLERFVRPAASASNRRDDGGLL